MTDREHERTALILGDDAVQRLAASCVAVLGLGGVGSYVTEALVRAGVGHLILVDPDTVDPSNINRQLYALHSTVGQSKAAAAGNRCRDIAPQAETETYQIFLTSENTEAFLRDRCSRADFIADCIDTVSTKIALAQICEKTGISLISCCGTGNKLDPSAFRIDDIYKTSVCPLCRVMRRELKGRHVGGLTVCWSPEEPVHTGTRTPGSVSFVPSAAGLLIASHIVKNLLR